MNICKKKIIKKMLLAKESIHSIHRTISEKTERWCVRTRIIRIPNRIRCLCNKAKINTSARQTLIDDYSEPCIRQWCQPIRVKSKNTEQCNTRFIFRDMREFVCRLIYYLHIFVGICFALKRVTKWMKSIKLSQRFNI